MTHAGQFSHWALHPERPLLQIVGRRRPSSGYLFAWPACSRAGNLLEYGATALRTIITLQQGIGIMPKQKTHKGTKKRFRLTATGKAKHRAAGTSHLAGRMSQKRKRNLRGTTCTSDVNVKSIQKALAGNSY